MIRQRLCLEVFPAMCEIRDASKADLELWQTCLRPPWNNREKERLAYITHRLKSVNEQAP